MKKPLLICFLVLLIDQAVKIWIKTHMTLGQEIAVAGEWFIIHFTENNGMAFGLELEGIYGKLFLSLFRIAAVGGIGYYLWLLVRDRAPNGLVASISLILAGAIGNIIDSSFYGMLFSTSGFSTVAEFMPADGGYSSFLHGKVVDMLYFPIIDTRIPDDFPFWAGERFIFFRPVFNIADSAISIGVAMIILFQKRYFLKPRLQRELKLVEPEADTPQEGIQLGHEWLVQQLGEQSIRLDYSVESVAALESLIEVEIKRGLPNRKSWIRKDFGKYLFGIAAYLGEVVKRQTEGATWETTDAPDSPDEAFWLNHGTDESPRFYPATLLVNRLQQRQHNDLTENVKDMIERFSRKALPDTES